MTLSAPYWVTSRRVSYDGYRTRDGPSNSMQAYTPVFTLQHRQQASYFQRELQQDRFPRAEAESSPQGSPVLVRWLVVPSRYRRVTILPGACVIYRVIVVGMCDVRVWCVCVSKGFTEILYRRNEPKNGLPPGTGKPAGIRVPGSRQRNYPQARNTSG